MAKITYILECTREDDRTLEQVKDAIAGPEVRKQYEEIGPKLANALYEDAAKMTLQFDIDTSDIMFDELLEQFEITVKEVKFDE